MLSLILFRHGKSDWDAPSYGDHERPLTERGREAAREMGRLLTATEQAPDLAVSSSAVRARDTLHLAAEAGAWRCPIWIEDVFYEHSTRDVLKWIQRLDSKAERLLLTGHEPIWTDLASRLIGQAALKIPTAAMVRIDCAIKHWSQLEFGRGELRWLLPPKLIQRSDEGRGD